jgi:poly-gamma-glutamate synthesis protein (capsule biosynthesis protein)
MRQRFLRAGFLVVLVLLTGCSAGHLTIVVTATPSLIPTFPTNPTVQPILPSVTAPAVAAQTTDVNAPPSSVPTVLPTFTSAPTRPPTNGAVRLWMSPNVPMEFQPALDQLVASGRYVWTVEDRAQVKLVGVPPGTASPLTARWLYVPVVPFASLVENVKWADIQRYWKGDVAALAYLSGNNKPPAFVAASATVAWLTVLLGAPAPQVQIEEVPPDGVAPALWLRRPAAWSLVPFDELDPAAKALTLDGASLFNHSLQIDQYPLVETYAFTGDAAFVNSTVEAVNATGKWIATNRDPAKMTILVMTGVTALTRATAFTMETKGITLPARDILPFLDGADLIHTTTNFIC